MPTCQAYCKIQRHWIRIANDWNNEEEGRVIQWTKPDLCTTASLCVQHRGSPSAIMPKRKTGDAGGNKAEVKDKPQKICKVVAKLLLQSQSPGLKRHLQRRERRHPKGRSDASKDGITLQKMELYQNRQGAESGRRWRCQVKFHDSILFLSPLPFYSTHPHLLLLSSAPFPIPTDPFTFHLYSHSNPWSNLRFYPIPISIWSPFHQHLHLYFYLQFHSSLSSVPASFSGFISTLFHYPSLVMANLSSLPSLFYLQRTPSLYSF